MYILTTGSHGLLRLNEKHSFDFRKCDQVHLKMDTTIEPVLEDHPVGHKEHGLWRQVVFGDRFIEM